MQDLQDAMNVVRASWEEPAVNSSRDTLLTYLVGLKKAGEAFLARAHTPLCEMTGELGYGAAQTSYHCTMTFKKQAK